MTTVVDSSVVVEALVGTGPVAAWAEGELARGPLVAPHSMPAEVHSVVRRLTLAGVLDERFATVVLDHLDAMTVDLASFAPFSARVWALRSTVTSYDAWYVALAEALGADLSTLDRRLATAPGPTCDFRTPSG